MLIFKRNERVNVLRLNETVDITWFIFQTYEKIYWEARCDSEIKEHLKKITEKSPSRDSRWDFDGSNKQFKDFFSASIKKRTTSSELWVNQATANETPA